MLLIFFFSEGVGPCCAQASPPLVGSPPSHKEPQAGNTGKSWSQGGGGETRHGPSGEREGASRKLGRLEPCSVGKQRLRRDLTKACKVLSTEKSINTVLPTKSQGAGISTHPLKLKADRFRIKKKNSQGVGIESLLPKEGNRLNI